MSESSLTRVKLRRFALSSHRHRPAAGKLGPAFGCTGTSSHRV